MSGFVVRCEKPYKEQVEEYARAGEARPLFLVFTDSTRVPVGRVLPSTGKILDVPAAVELVADDGKRVLVPAGGCAPCCDAGQKMCEPLRRRATR